MKNSDEELFGRVNNSDQLILEMISSSINYRTYVLGCQSPNGRIEKSKDKVIVDAKILSIVPVKGETAVRMDLTSDGALTDDGSHSPTQALKVYVN